MWPSSDSGFSNLQVSLQGCSLVLVLQSKTKYFSRKRYWRCLVSGIASNDVKVGSRQFPCIPGPTGADSPGLCFNMFVAVHVLIGLRKQTDRSPCVIGPTTLSNMSMSGPDFGIGSVSLLEITWNSILALAESTHSPASPPRSDRFVQWWMTWLSTDGSRCARTGKEPLVFIACERCHHQNQLSPAFCGDKPQKSTNCI